MLSSWDGVEVALVAAALVAYGGLVFMSYLTLPSRYPLKLDLGRPGRSALGLLVWWGVEALRAVMRVPKYLLDLLSESSADVGEWVMSRRGPEGQADFRSRFL
ncbi:MAG: hypothetical protein DMG25_04990 [Acidobacteria bacterium]|nr:MAG: hypothetical protein DMG25_04990 [Acidobacteriota bacterium]PYV25751.1 MAG: hypothetical protein DMG27_08860 [Acidobacteriota bacterium]